MKSKKTLTALPETPMINAGRSVRQPEQYEHIYIEDVIATIKYGIYNGQLLSERIEDIRAEQNPEVRKIVSASIETDINQMKKDFFDKVDKYSKGIKRNLQEVETMKLNEEKTMKKLNDQIYDIKTKIDELKAIEREIRSKLTDL